MKNSFFAYHSFALVFTIFFSTLAFSQVPKTFSGDSAKFFSEIEELFTTVKGKEKEGSDFIKDKFKPFWFGGDLSPDKRQFVYKTSIAMLQKKLRPFPDYYNFFSALINFYTTAKLDEKSFQSWKTSAEKLIAKSSAKKLSDFLESSNDLFSTNKLYSSPA